MKDFLEIGPYALNAPAKSALLLERLNQLTAMHYRQSSQYASILDAYGEKPGIAATLAEVPWLAVRLFKMHRLASIPDEAVFKTLTSSGTTGAPSRIVLDGETAGMQTKALVKLMQSFLGRDRLPMIVIDHPSVVKDRRSFSARGAGILGMANFGRDHFYCLEDETMALRLDELEGFVAGRRGPFLLFGFTFMVWRYFAQALQRLDRIIDLQEAILVHSGGWKKMEEEKVDNAHFKAILRERANITRVHNFYGMVEQVGSVFVECEQGRLHAPVFSDVIVRRPVDWSVAAKGEAGVLQLLSALPQSYPGHSIMTEDEGILLGEDDCACGRQGKYFSVTGRVSRAEARGCSDTHVAA